MLHVMLPTYPSSIHNQRQLGNFKLFGLISKHSASGLGLEGFLTVIDPPSVDDRIARQSGVFTAYISTVEHEVVYDHSELLKHLETLAATALLTKVKIPSISKSAILHELTIAGKDPFSIFPDIHGLIELAMDGYYRSLLYWQREREKWRDG